MRILSLQLENIKSYHEPTDIIFTAGLNAVCGQNGSGKTTILEAIGCALFDYMPYNRSAFVREGERSGTIRVRILANDEREYEVVRKVGSPNQHYIVDVESDARLVDRGPEVVEWIRTRALGIDGHTDLEALFRNAVGVPQGLMTSHFLDTAANRKRIFDSFLRVEEYSAANKELLATVNYLRDTSANVDRDISRLEGETSVLPDWRARADTQDQRIRLGIERTAELQEFVTRLEKQCSELEKRAGEIVILQGNLRAAEYDLKRYSEQEAEADRLLTGAHAAREALQQSQHGYQQKQDADIALKKLDTQRDRRTQLETLRSDVAGRLAGIQDTIERLEGHIARATAAAATANSLAPGVEQQSTLEQTFRELQVELRGQPQLESRQTTLHENLSATHGRVADRAQRLQSAYASAQQAQKLPELQELVQRTRTRLAMLEPLQAERLQVATDGKTCKARVKELSELARQHTELQAEFDRLQPRAQRLDTVIEQQQELRENRVRLNATLQYREVARESLARGDCPLLDLACPVVASSPALLDRFDGGGESVRLELQQIANAIPALETEVVECRKASARAQEIAVLLAKYEETQSHLDDARAALTKLVHRHNELDAELSAGPAVEAELRAALSELEVLERHRDAGKLIPELQEQQALDERSVLSIKKELDELTRQLADMETKRVQATRTEQELKLLADPRKRQSDALAVAADLPRLEGDRERDRERVREAEQRLGELEISLAEYDGLDERIREQRDIVDRHQQAYETYLRNKDEAARVSEREAARNSARESVASAAATRESVRSELSAIQETYSESEHKRLRTELEDTREMRSAENAHLQTARADHRETEQKLAELTKLQHRLEIVRAERDELGTVANALTFIRSTINAAGPIVTQSLLAQISGGANDIFEEIMDDHSVELRWDRDYEIIVQRGAETREFKQLSGGEQMSAALAVRLALLKEMSEVDFAFFDEPTQNMDGDRRSNLANQIANIRGFEQLIVISHDDTFDHSTDNLIRLAKVQEETRLDER